MTKRCMLDIETLGIHPKARILSLGAVVVGNTYEAFYQEYDQLSQYGRTIDGSTVNWWKEQKVAMPNGSTPLSLGLKDFSDWCAKQSFDEFWCKGTNFDFVILENAYAEEAFEPPWKYYQLRDYRTVAKLFPNIINPFEAKVHHALVDAFCQAASLKHILDTYERILKTS